MKKTLAYIFCVVISAVCMAFGWKTSNRFFEARRDAQVHEKLESVAATVNKTAPRMLDKITRLDRVEVGPGRRFTWVYTLVSIPSKQIDAAKFRATVEPQLKKNVKQSEALEPMREVGTTIVYRYIGNDGVEIGEIAIAPTDAL